MSDLRTPIQSLSARELISLTIFHKTLMEVGTVHDCELRRIAEKYNTSSDPFHILFMLDKVAFETQQELDRRDDSELHGEWNGGPRYVIRYTNGGYNWGFGTIVDSRRFATRYNSMKEASKVSRKLGGVDYIEQVD